MYHKEVERRLQKAIDSVLDIIMKGVPASVEKPISDDFEIRIEHFENEDFYGNQIGYISIVHDKPWLRVHTFLRFSSQRVGTKLIFKVVADQIDWYYPGGLDLEVHKQQKSDWSFEVYKG